MRIAQISPLTESVPPRGYGGTERIVSYLTDALVRQGHKVTLFATADSKTEAKLVPCARRALRQEEVCDPLAYIVMMLDKVRQASDQFDILHFHIEYVHVPLFEYRAGTTLTTLHGRQDRADSIAFYRCFSKMPLVAISNSQKTPLAGANFVSTIHHGVPIDLYPPNFKAGGNYFAFVGRISPEKRCDRAIQIALATGMPLKIAAKVDRVDQAYFKEKIEPLLNNPSIEFVGEIDERAKIDFIGQAAALLFPIDWPEPFGLVMIEAMACGTPVLAFKHGAVPEVIDESVTGIIVNSVEEAIREVPRLLALDRRKIRRQFEKRFTADHMAANYVRLYQSMLCADEQTMELEHSPVTLRRGRSSSADRELSSAD
jgi:glycosyltransferase involved in cell wall biosynthesis